jgi:DNA-binding XRE family transcriptional regulator
VDYSKFPAIKHSKGDEVIEGNSKYANLRNGKGHNQGKGRKHKIPFKKKMEIVAKAELGMDKDVVAKEAGITKQTVYNLMESLRQNKNLTLKQKQFLDDWDTQKLNMADDMQLLVKCIYENINIADIEKCSLPQKVTSAAILVDKMLLLKGEATQRVAFEGLSDEELNKIRLGENAIEAEVVEQV